MCLLRFYLLHSRLCFPLPFLSSVFAALAHVDEDDSTIRTMEEFSRYSFHESASWVTHSLSSLSVKSESPSPASRKKSPFLVVAFVFLGFIVCTILYNESSNRQISRDPDQVPQKQPKITYVKPSQSARRSKAPGVLDRFSRCNSTREYSGRKIRWGEAALVPGQRRVDLERCNALSGRWVFDNVVPDAQRAGMPIHVGPAGLPRAWEEMIHSRWSVTEMWDKLRGKRLTFVGDSLNRGQWILMLCLLHSATSKDKRSITPNAPLTIFRSEEYTATVEFFWAPLLVESNSNDLVNHTLDERIIRPDSILKRASQWEHADILVFNTYLWWRQGPIKLLWSDDENGDCEELVCLGTIELATETWADWVTSKLDPRKKILFVTIAPAHLFETNFRNCTSTSLFLSSLMCGKHQQRIVFHWPTGCRSKNFPSGTKALAYYVHDRGLKFGIYSDIG
ncbi:Methyltransf_11 domain-containing protein [Psidium guajava]|nr:Methyltransf_11 domain-containing protein [Psidium guajava]